MGQRRIRLPRQGTQVQSLVWEGSTWLGATKAHVPQLLSPTTPTIKARVPRACAAQEKPLQWEACALQWRAAPAHCSKRKPVRSHKDPEQWKDKLNKEIEWYSLKKKKSQAEKKRERERGTRREWNVRCWQRQYKRKKKIYPEQSWFVISLNYHKTLWGWITLLAPIFTDEELVLRSLSDRPEITQDRTQTQVLSLPSGCLLLPYAENKPHSQKVTAWEM